mgnify:FL=1|jgi:hypothetical protein
MKTIKKLIRKPIEAEYADIHVYDNLDEYLNEYNNGNDFVRIGYENWKKAMIDGQCLYSFSDMTDEMYLTEDTYKELLELCDKKYTIHERDLFRTQKHSNTRYAEESSVERLLDYMKDENKSWLPQICNEINEDIKKLEEEMTRIQYKINHLEIDKLKLYDKDYLQSKMKIEYTFDSKKYKEEKNGIYHK